MQICFMVSIYHEDTEGFFAQNAVSLCIGVPEEARKYIKNDKHAISEKHKAYPVQFNGRCQENMIRFLHTGNHHVGRIPMARIVGIGHQDFETVITKGIFYIDKTSFIKEWWENEDSVTLIARPRRFGKTLNMSMVEKFFSMDYAGRGDPIF